MDDRPRRCAPLRVEHRALDGAVRVLLITSMRAVASRGVAAWTVRLRRQGHGGTIVLVADDSDNVLATYPIPAPAYG
jgi:hypothetical protein